MSGLLSLEICMERIKESRERDGYQKCEVRVIGKQRDLYLNVWPILFGVSVTVGTTELMNEMLQPVSVSTEFDAVIVDSMSIEEQNQAIDDAKQYQYHHVFIKQKENLYVQLQE
jgi:hypothetical protein